MMKQFFEETGFTLIDLLTSLFIIVLLAGIIFTSYRQSEQQFALQRSANKLAQDIRKVQAMTMGAVSYNLCLADWRMKGYGMNLTASDDFYLLKARCEEEASPGNYDDQTLLSGSLSLEKGVIIQSLSPTNPLDIFFYPPEPGTDFGIGNEATITLTLQADTTRTRIIKVSKAGLIEIQ